MKPIIDGKGIVARLGNRELTKEELHRLPLTLKNRVKFYSDGHERKDELDKDLAISIRSGLVVAKLDGKELTAEEWKNLPDDARKDKVTFNTTENGKNYPNMPLKDRINMLKGGIGWETREGIIKEIGISDEEFERLIKHGLVMYINKEYVIDNRDGKALERIDKFLGRDKHNILTEWATKDELSKMLDVPLENIDVVLNRHIDAGFIEEKDGKYRINDEDGKGTERINKYLDELDGAVKKGKVTVYDAISGIVKGGIYEAIKKGWIEFMDGRTYTTDEWKNLTDEEKETIGVRLTEKGRREMEDGNPLKIFDELGKKKLDEGGLNLVKDTYEKDGMIYMNLTEEGEKVKQMGIAMGVSPKKVFQTMINIGLDKEISKYMLLENSKVIDGHRREEVQRTKK